jgi:predicted patatin/cPLA2 family phospholipase
MSNLLSLLKAHENNPSDNRVFGLVLEGGGMRGVYSAAAAVPLMTYKVSDAFEHINGSSAGALNAAYMMADDLDSYLVYADDLTNKNFINLLPKDKKVDIDNH